MGIASDWFFPLLGIVVGLVSGLFGAWVGVKVGIARLEIHVEGNKKDIKQLQEDSARYNEDILMHDLELEDVMRGLEIPRKRRQSWRFGR